MEHIENEPVQFVRIKHHISCDNCGAPIAVETEYEDGYYNEHRTEIKVNIGGCLIFNKQLCSYCIPKILTKFKNILIEAGFEQEKVLEV